MYCEHATVCSCEIIGLTIASTREISEQVSFVNELCAVMDDVIQLHDVFKVKITEFHTN